MKSKTGLFILFNIITFWEITGVLSESLQCLDEDGNPVDWFVVYKLPKLPNKQNRFIKNGTAYKYITSNSLADGWTMPQKSITEDDTLVAKTLQPFYSKNQDDIWLIYNDQFIGRTSSTFGHTKGIVGANKEGGFWLIHSVPKFPVNGSTFAYPNTGRRYGQSMLCISLPTGQIDQLGKIFMYNRPKFIKKRISKNIKALYPNLVSAAKGASIVSAPWNLSSTIYSNGGINFINFAKARNFNKDLYEWVAENFRTSMYAETWQNEKDPLPSYCTKFQVLNINSILFQDNSKMNITFSSHKDHSKWTISDSVDKPWVCIGDINRALPQERRGGGTTCLENKELWEAYTNIIDRVSSCKDNRRK